MDFCTDPVRTKFIRFSGHIRIKGLSARFRTNRIPLLIVSLLYEVSAQPYGRGFRTGPDSRIAASSSAGVIMGAAPDWRAAHGGPGLTWFAGACRLTLTAL